MRSIRHLAVALSLAGATAIAQEAPADKPAEKGAAASSNMQILREKVRADRKLLVAENMELTEAEGTAFWPVYDAFQKDMGQINQRLMKTIKDYADAYNAKAVTDELAGKLTDEVIAIDQAELDLKKEYLPKFRAVLPNTKVARYMQIENKVRAVVKYDLARGIPLVNVQ
jgi:hypothetical protein